MLNKEQGITKSLFSKKQGNSFESFNEKNDIMIKRKQLRNKILNFYDMYKKGPENLVNVLIQYYQIMTRNREELKKKYLNLIVLVKL